MFKNHRKYQLLKWIAALEDGYSDLSTCPPTAPNLAYYLISDADYRTQAINEKFNRFRQSKKEVLTFIKNDISRRMQQYAPELFDQYAVRKTEENHITLSEGIETRKVTTTSYALSSRGRSALNSLEQTISDKQDLITTVNHKRARSRGQSVIFEIVDPRTKLKPEPFDELQNLDNPYDIQIDKFVIPHEGSYSWETQTVTVPHVKFQHSESDTLILPRDPDST